MDPNSGQIYGGEARAALERQYAERPNDRPLKKLIDRLVPIPATDLAGIEAMNIRQRKGWAKARNQRKRTRQGR